MKFALTALVLSAFTATSASAGWLDSVATKDWETKKSDKYKLEAYGFDLRVYEWNPRGNSNVTCITAFSEKGPIGLQCFENEEKDRKK
jgi:hypothetical protein